MAISTAIVSPTARPTPSSTAASRPLRAAGSSTRYTSCQRVAPSAIPASRYESGTALSASSPIETITGTLMRARMMPPFSTLTPTGAPVVETISRLITVRPTKPQTTLGIADSSSIVILSVSRTRGAQNSDR